MTDSNMKKALVVDDEPDARLFVSTVLQEEGWETFEVDKGSQTVQKATEISPNLIVLDIQMPDMNGLDVITELRMNDRTADIPVVMLTGIATQTGMGFSAEEMEDWLGERPQAYLEKPVSPVELKNAVRKVTGGA